MSTFVYYYFYYSYENIIYILIVTYDKKCLTINHFNWLNLIIQLVCSILDSILYIAIKGCSSLTKSEQETPNKKA